MEPVTDWLRLWREISEARAKGREQPKSKGDAWRKRARTFDQQISRRWSEPDSSRRFVISRLKANPGSTILDIGAGTGSWALLLAQHAAQVTALDPSPTMIQVMQEKVQKAGCDNVQIVQGAWPAAQVEPHDYSLCSHAMYGVPDFATFVRRMEAVTRQTCFLLMRAPTADGVMAEAALHIWGQPYDSPNFQIGYNALLQMGLFPSVLMEDTGLWRPWTHDTLEEALSDVKRRLGLIDDTYDAFLQDLLNQRLTYQDGAYVWPRGVRSALVYWDVGTE